MNELSRIKDLIVRLNEASYAYYQNDDPIMADKKYDELYDELVNLEQSTGIVLAASPTRKVQGFLLDKLKKVKHIKPMLSAAKTKLVDEIDEFVCGKQYYASYKLDGLTLVITYKNGFLEKAVTRGNGEIGEDVTEQAKMILNLPVLIPYKDELVLRGECVISWRNFERINNTLETPYSHPRNLAAGSIRNLDTNMVRLRSLEFIVFECVSNLQVSNINTDSKWECLRYLDSLSFTTVDRRYPVDDDLSSAAFGNELSAEKSEYPVDGLIFEIDSKKLSDTLGATSHHENCRMALKWKDTLYETTLRDIEWSTSRTGLVNPVAVFDEVDLDGASTTKATLHNVSYIEDLELGIGDEIQVYRANMVIPKVHENLTRSGNYKIPEICPCCGAQAEIHNDNGSKTLRCMNPDCDAKLLNRLIHFCSKKCLDIEGLSDATLEKFFNKGWLHDFIDIFHLKDHYDEIAKLDGFGKKSADKIILAIENARCCSFDRFIGALGIPLIGSTASKSIAKYLVEIYWNRADRFGGAHPCGTMGMYYCLVSENLNFDSWTCLDDFGAAMSSSLYQYINTHAELEDLAKEFIFDIPFTDKNKTENIDLSGKIFCITGSLNHFANREELKGLLESMGAKVSGSVSAKTTALINNDSKSASSKNIKAKSLGIPVLTEEEFLEQYYQ